MGHRLSKVVTRTGDGGDTGLGDGRRISKASPRIAAVGEVDELNSHIGLLLAIGVPADELQLGSLLLAVQQDLFDLGGELSIPGYSLLQPERLAALDQWLEKANATLPRLKEFILPGGSVAAAQAHVCRTICRRAERAVVALGETEKVSEISRQYLNRLSDVLFVIARLLNRAESKDESLWQRDRQ